jgi:hypothetical protein
MARRRSLAHHRRRTALRMAGRRSRWPCARHPGAAPAGQASGEDILPQPLDGVAVWVAGDHFGSTQAPWGGPARAAARCRTSATPAENSHRPTRQRERRMRRFKSAGHARRFLAAYGAIAPRLRPWRHAFPARAYRLQMTPRFQRCSVQDVSPRSCSSCKRSHWLTNHCCRFRLLGHRRRHGPGLDPAPCGNVDHTHPTCEQELFDITVAEAEPEIEPDAMTDHLSQEAVVLVRVRRWCTDASRLAHQAALNKPRNKLIIPWDPRVHHGESPKASLALRVGNFEGEG